MKKQWIEKNGLETPFAAALYGAPSRFGFYVTHQPTNNFCFHNFHATYAAKHFLDIIIDGRDFKWINKQTILTEHGFHIRAEYHTDLESAIEYDYKGTERDWEFPEPYQTMFLTFAGKVRPKTPRDTHAAASTPKREHTPPPPRPDGLTSLAEICAGLNIDPREARQALRKSNTPKPEWGWAWKTKEEVTKITRIIQGK